MPTRILFSNSHLFLTITNKLENIDLIRKHKSTTEYRNRNDQNNIIKTSAKLTKEQGMSWENVQRLLNEGKTQVIKLVDKNYKEITKT